MVQIFAGFDSFGELRYISEVPSGLSCGCFCVTCGARLIARKGETNDPHFGHESGQQRPECLVGARNLVRRILSEYLQTHALPIPTRYQTLVQVGALADQASWNLRIVRTLEWKPKPGPDSPAAIVELEHGFKAELVIITDGEDPKFTSSSPDVGRLVLHAPLPTAESLRSKDTIAPHLAAHMRLEWVHLPDPFGVIESTRRSLVDKQRRSDESARQFEMERQRAAGQRWGRVRSAMGSGSRHPPNTVEPPAADATDTRLHPHQALEPSTTASGNLNNPQAVHPYAAWAEGHILHSGIFCYLFKDGSQWVLLKHSQLGLILRPFPVAEEGWDEFFPRHVGLADPVAQCYLMPDLLGAFSSMDRYARAMRNSSVPSTSTRKFRNVMPSHFLICILSSEGPLDGSLQRVSRLLPSIDLAA